MKKLTKASYNKFLKHLIKTYPIDIPNYKIQMDMVKDDIYNEEMDCKAYGVVAYNEEGAYIQVMTVHPMVTLKYIAHEYRHLVQRYNMNYDESAFTPINPTSSVINNPELEKDAQLFGNEEAWKWARSEGYLNKN